MAPPKKKGVASGSVSSPTPQKTSKNDKTKDDPSAVDTKSKARPIKCKECGKICLDQEFHDNIDDDSIECDICGGWYHKPCTNSTTPEWEVLKGGNENVTYKCDRCLVNKAQVTDKQYEMFSEMLLKNNEKIFSRFDEFETKMLLTIDQKINERMREFDEKNRKEIDELKAKISASSPTKQNAFIDNKIPSFFH